ncbi:MAG: capsular polysaccharide biosynthesis protein [Clostridiales bacterium]|nr:capsular polysaccharide biosynthesis protein [Clostridiales bacterium]
MEQTPKELSVQQQIVPAERDEAEIDLLELFYHILDHWKLVFVCFLIGAVLVGGYTKLFMKPTYEATAKMYVLSSSDSVVNLSDLQLGTYLASDYLEVFKTHEVTNAVIQNLNLPYAYKDMQKMLNLSNPSGTRILHITVRCGDPAEAALIANEYLRVASQYVADVMVTDKPTELSVALEPERPVGPSTSRNAILGALAGTILACGILIIRFLLDDKVKTGEDITKLTGLPILAEVPVFAMKQANEAEQAAAALPGKDDAV